LGLVGPILVSSGTGELSTGECGVCEVREREFSSALIGRRLVVVVVSLLLPGKT
jgi:hypothetical protein